METQQQKVIVTHYSALLLLRYARLNNAKISYSKFNQESARTITNSEANELRNFIDTISPQHNQLDILISRRSQSCKISEIKCHVCSNKLPPMSFVSISTDDKMLQAKIFGKIIIASPMLIISQMSVKVPFFRLLQWSLELCGNYIITPNSEEGFVFTDSPITDPRSIKTYIKNLNNCRVGSARVKSLVAKYVTKNSASPAETNLYILLCGPRTHGFFGVKDLQLNHKIKISAKAKTVCGQQYIKPDLCNPKRKLAIEYDSKQFHTDEIQNQKDKRRISALVHDGWHVTTIVPYQLHNFNAFSNIATSLLKKNRQDPRIRSKAFEEKARRSFIVVHSR